jgi:hypothetical protein
MKEMISVVILIRGVVEGAVEKETISGKWKEKSRKRDEERSKDARVDRIAV